MIARPRTVLATLELDGILVLGVTAAFLALLVTEKASYAALGVALMIVLPLTGVIDGTTAVAGLANKAVVTIAGLYVVGAGLTRTGALEFVGEWLTRTGGGSERRMVLLTCLAAAALSAFMNDTAVVVVFIPILLRQAADSGIPASRLLMPLSFAALLGGMCTLVGTSTNLIVSGLASKFGAEPLTMFGLAPVGVPMALICIVFVALTSHYLLPARRTLSSMLVDKPAREFVTELGIGAESTLIGKSCRDAFAEASRITPMFVVRDGVMQPAGRFSGVLRADDVLILRGRVEELLRLQADHGLDALQDVSLDSRSVELFEVALAPNSMLVGSTVGGLGLREQFGATTIAVLRAGQHLHDRVAQLPLQSGDALLVCGDEDSRARLGRSQDFFLLASEEHDVALPGGAKVALAIAACVVALLAANSLLGWKAVPPSSAAMAGALAMTVFRCVSPRDAFASISWPVLVFIAGTLALGEAMRASRVAEVAADLMVDGLAGFGVAAVASGLVLLGFLFNFLVSHSAVAALFTPIGLAAAARLAGDAGHAVGSDEWRAIEHALMLAVCYGGSMCFATPVAHQVNLMVLGPGGYRYVDFLKLGLPVSLVAWIVASFGIPLATGVW